MTISKTRLKRIIKEELLSEAFGPVDGSGLKSAGDDLKASIGQIASTLDGAGEDVRTGSITAAGQVPRIMQIMQELEKMVRKYEQQTNYRLDAAEKAVNGLKKTVTQTFARMAPKDHDHGDAAEEPKAAAPTSEEDPLADMPDIGS